MQTRKCTAEELKALAKLCPECAGGGQVCYEWGTGEVWRSCRACNGTGDKHAPE